MCVDIAAELGQLPEDFLCVQVDRHVVLLPYGFGPSVRTTDEHWTEVEQFVQQIEVLESIRAH